MNKTIITIDVGNIPPEDVYEYVEKLMCHYRKVPYIPKSKFKRWIQSILDTISIMGSFGGI